MRKGKMNWRFFRDSVHKKLDDLRYGSFHLERARAALDNSNKELDEWRSVVHNVARVLDPKGNSYFWKKHKESIPSEVLILRERCEQAEKNLNSAISNILLLQDEIEEMRARSSISNKRLREVFRAGIREVYRAMIDGVDYTSPTDSECDSIIAEVKS